MFLPFTEKVFADYVAHLLQDMTGNKTKVVGVRTQWIVRLYTGNGWVDA